MLRKSLAVVAGCLSVAALMSDWGWVHAQSAPAPQQREVDRRYGIRPRDLLYVAVPGYAGFEPDDIGVGILVFDVKHDFKFVKRIPTWDYPAGREPEDVKGIAA